ncbi:MAG: hypothetical protein IJ225_04430 [Solobacterium sp.]|nr:hypothetical protein [Solobacterium sp.]
MIKRILISLLTLMVGYSAVVIGIKLFEPDSGEAQSDSWIHTSALDYDSLREYTLSSGSGTSHFYLFSSSDNSDCIYVESTVLKNTATDTGMNLDDLIEIVDITDLERNLNTNRLRTDWGILSYPAFLACHVSQGEIIIDNTLEWNPSSPISVDDVERWLTRNGIYEGTGIEEAIDTPEF